ncbi:hypothetical protein JEP40_11810 [Proteus vulgaris]|nr:hypothetical protein [Proteus vulgaris]MBI6529794.1 hypothetical protein [Proteus vulgaris]
MMEIIFSSSMFSQLITHNNAISCGKNTDNEKERKEATVAFHQKKIPH